MGHIDEYVAGGEGVVGDLGDAGPEAVVVLVDQQGTEHGISSGMGGGAPDYRPNMASHCSSERGMNTKLVDRVWPMVADGCGEYRCPG